MDSTRKIGVERIPKLLAAYSLPVFAGYLANSVYNIIARAFIGNSAGALGIAAISVAFPITLIQVSFAFLVGLGGSTLSAIRVGEGNKDAANRIMNSSFLMIAVLAVVFTILGNVFIYEILSLFGASREVLPYAREYGSVLLFGTLFQMISLGMTNYMRVEGKTRLAMISVIASPPVNVFFAWYFIRILHWGLSGAALATVLGQMCSAGIIVVHFLTNKDFLKVNRTIFKIDVRQYLKIAYLGLSPFAVQFTQGLMMVLLNIVIKSYGGDGAISGMGIVSTLQQFLVTPVNAVNMGSQALIGYNFGSKKYDRVRELVKKGILATTVIVIAEYIAIRVFTVQIVSLFSASDRDLIAFAGRALLIFLFMLPLIPLQVQGAGYFQAVGKPIHSILLSLSRQVFILIPALLIMPRFLGLDGILYAGPVSDFISFGITVPVFIRHLTRLGRQKQQGTGVG